MKKWEFKSFVDIDHRIEQIATIDDDFLHERMEDSDVRHLMRTLNQLIDAHNNLAQVVAEMKTQISILKKSIRIHHGKPR